jgi:hypothetical protein
MLTDEDKQWILERLARLEQRLGERLDKVESTLRSDFHERASPAELRLRTHAAVLAIDTDFESIADQIKKRLEGRQPPPSQ